MAVEERGLGVQDLFERRDGFTGLARFVELVAGEQPRRGPAARRAGLDRFDRHRRIRVWSQEPPDLERHPGGPAVALLLGSLEEEAGQRDPAVPQQGLRELAIGLGSL